MLLPLVPVTHTTRDRSASSSHRPSAADDRRAAGLDALDLGAVAADAGRLDHDVAPGQRVEPQPARRQDRPAVEPAVGRAVVDEHGLDAERGELADGGPALDARAPTPRPTRPGRSDQEIAGGVAHRGCSARRRGGAGPRWRRGQGSRSPSSVDERPAGPGVAVAVGPGGGESHGGPALVDRRRRTPRASASPDVSTQRLGSGGAGRVGERLAPPNTAASRSARHERGQDQVDEARTCRTARTSGRGAGPGRCGSPVAALEGLVVLAQGRRSARR